ncbi:MAG: sigma 54-interacting transcriptional regulator [Planctomycetota bacterium]|nr:sigma 54-interacting transcriptional regulator [Planctomycetota bacterium]
MTKQKNASPYAVGISFYGRDRDRRGERIRPTLSLGAQEDICFDEFHVLYTKENEKGCRELVEDLEDIFRERERERKKTCRIRMREIAFADMFDFNNALKVLRESFQAIAGETPENAKLYIGVATGTHVMHFAVYFIADKQRLPRPAKMAVIKISDKEDDAARSAWKDKAVVLSPKWSDYEEVERDFSETRRRSAETIFPQNKSGNEEWRKEEEKLGAVSSETEEPILLLGATGTGKSRAAEILHKKSRRGNRPLVQFNCATLRGDLAREALFGHGKAAFTGAKGERDGLLAKADGATLFLDEIGDLALDIQSLLLTALEKKPFYRVGEEGGPARQSDFRLIAATNRNLGEMVAKGTFRADLYARISNWTFTLPTLREMREDWSGLLDDALLEWGRQKEGAGESRAPVVFSAGGREAFLRLADEHNWRGNYRDFNNVVWRLATLASLEHYGAMHSIDAESVREEFARMRSQEHDVSSQDAFCERLHALAQSRFPDACLMDGVERLFQEWALRHKEGVFERCGKLLYGSVLKPIANYSSRFRNREQILRKRLEEGGDEE